MGRELDWLADVVSFGVAPAAIAVAAGVNTRFGSNDPPVLCRLRGEPIGAVQRHGGASVRAEGQSGILRGHTDADEHRPARHMIALLFLPSGLLIISKPLRIPKP